MSRKHLGGLTPISWLGSNCMVLANLVVACIQKDKRQDKNTENVRLQWPKKFNHWTDTEPHGQTVLSGKLPPRKVVKLLFVKLYFQIITPYSRQNYLQDVKNNFNNKVCESKCMI